METLIDSASSKTINYAYTSSVIADDEFINAAAPPHQRPMLPPPPPTSQASPSPPQQPSDVYDCCVSLDGIPIKHEFQYTFSDTDGHGKITKRDVEGLATKILESMYGTTLKFSSRGQRTVKVTLNIRQSVAVVVDGTTTGTPYRGHQSSRERKTKSSTDRHHRSKTDAVESGMFDDATLLEQSGYPSVYDGVKGSWLQHHKSAKLGEQRYRREQLIEMVQRSLAENLSFQNQRKSNKPEVVYHRPRTKRRQTGAQPAKVAWSPYDFEPVAYIPSHHHHLQQQHYRQYEHLKNVKSQQQQLYSNGAVAEEHAVKYSSSHSRQHHRATAVVGGSNLKQSKDSAAAATTTTTTAAATAAQEQTKNIDHQRYKRAKLASKKIHHHIHEHHHYHHYDYYIV